MPAFKTLLPLAALLFAVAAQASTPWDGRPNHYRIAIDAEHRQATIDADLWLGSDTLSMYHIAPTDDLPNGQADLVDDMVVRDAGDGRVLTLENLGDGDFRLDGGRRITLQYRVRLEHDRHHWPAGSEEVAYWTDEGLMVTAATLLFADGGDTMAGPIEVGFALPAGWHALTPWQPIGDDGLRFAVGSRRELVSNALFLGTIEPIVLQAGGIELTLALGRRYRQSRALFVDLLQRQLASYRQLFAATPEGGRYLIVVNDGASGDGGAFANSFSQYIDGDATLANRVVWGYVMAHELLHYWNGLSIVPADDREEWFKEGATDYLTIVTLARNGLLDENMLFKRLENVPRRYLIARMAQQLGMSVRAAGADKQAHRQLVYGGGSLAALALDVELRRASDDRVGLPELMQALQRDFGNARRRYTLADIVRHANALCRCDVGPLLTDAVEREGWFDIRPSYREIGLRLDSFVDEMFISVEPTATPAQQARFRAIFAAR